MADDLVGEMLLTVADEAELRGEARGIKQVLALLKNGKPPEETLQFYGEAAF